MKDTIPSVPWEFVASVCLQPLSIAEMTRKERALEEGRGSLLRHASDDDSGAQGRAERLEIQRSRWRDGERRPAERWGGQMEQGQGTAGGRGAPLRYRQKLHDRRTEVGTDGRVAPLPLPFPASPGLGSWAQHPWAQHPPPQQRQSGLIPLWPSPASPPSPSLSLPQSLPQSSPLFKMSFCSCSQTAVPSWNQCWGLVAGS